MRLKEVSAAVEEPLILPIHGTDYEIQRVDGLTGIKLQDYMGTLQGAIRREKAGEKVDFSDLEFGDEDDLNDLEEQCLGVDVRNQMIADGVSRRVIQVAGMTAFFWQTMSDDGEMAARYWESGGKVQASNRAQRRTATRTPAGAATTTRKPASRTGTRSSKAKTTASRGRKS